MTQYPGLVVGLVMAIYAAFIVIGSLLEDTFLPHQMEEKYPLEGKFIPGIADTFIYAQLVMAFLAGYIVQHDTFDWTIHWNSDFFIATIVICIVVAVVFHVGVVLGGNRPAVLGWNGLGGAHVVGWLNLPLLVVGMTVTALHFVQYRAGGLHFRTVDTLDAIIIGTLLMIVVQCMFHVPMKGMQSTYQFYWYESPLDYDPKQLWFVVGGCTAVAVLTLITGGLLPAFISATVGVIYYYFFVWFLTPG